MAILQLLWSLAYTILPIVIGILGICFIVGFHELGHFLFGKLFKIKTPSFSIGFGPRLLSKKIGETEFILSAIPLGGYVEFAGNPEIGQGDQKEAMSLDKDSFAAKPYYQKMIVMAGGIAFNILFAYAVFILLCITGLPQSEFLYPLNAIPVIRTIDQKSTAEVNHLQPGDTIVSINEAPIGGDIWRVINLIKPLANTEAIIVVERNGQQQTIPIMVDARTVGNEVVGSLNIKSFETAAVPGLPFFESIKKGIILANFYIKQIFVRFISIFAQRDTSQLGGPLMIISETAKGAANGYKVLLLLLAIISINLAILNLVPLPILDGGQMVFYTIEAIVRRPLPNKIKEYIHIGSWILILLLIIYVSAKDIIRLVYPLIQRIMSAI